MKVKFDASDDYRKCFCSEEASPLRSKVEVVSNQLLFFLVQGCTTSVIDRTRFPLSKEHVRGDRSIRTVDKLSSARRCQQTQEIRQKVFHAFRKNMLKSYPARYPASQAGTRVIRLRVDQEAVLQEQFNRWPRAPHTADIVLLAAETGLSEADVEGWYAIRLAQWRKEQGLGGNLGLH